ncbi:MAG: glycosyltransferase family 9 protein [Cyanobacteria bacterium RUI128]|nr:glycosyltransferase family 9 protein [Cyanobacteria bacterium RUI128]
MQKVLIISLGNIAQTVYTLPLAGILKDNGIRVDYVVSEKGFSVINKNPKIDRVFLMSMERWTDKWLNTDTWEAFFKQIERVKSVSYDIVIDCQQDIRSLLTFAMCNGKRKLTYSDAKGFAAIGGNEVIPKSKLDTKNMVERNLYFLKYLNIPYNDFYFPMPEIDYTFTLRHDKTFELLDKDKKTIIICAGAKNENKQWSAVNWQTLIERIKDKYNLVFTGGILDKRFVKEIGGEAFLNLVGETRVESFIDVLKRADIVITSETEACALAWAVGKPRIITIFTCTDPAKYSPIDYNDKEKYKSLYGKIECQPCESEVCLDMGEARCRKFPTVEDVIRALE